MKTGTVKFFNEEKGFGFIIQDDGSEDVFVHKSGLTETIHENDKVEFDLTQGRKGLNAVDVKVVR